MRSRRKRAIGSWFKARIALEALRETKIMTELCQEHDLHANQIIDWKRQLIEGATGVFGAPPSKAVDTSALEAKIGRPTMENDFLSLVWKTQKLGRS